MTKLAVLIMCLLFIAACTNTNSENTNDTLTENITENNDSEKISSADVEQLCAMEYGPDCPVEKVVECSRDSDIIYKIHYGCTDVGVDIYEPSGNKFINCGVLIPTPEPWCENLSEYECSVTDLCSLI